MDQVLELLGQAHLVVVSSSDRLEKKRREKYLTKEIKEKTSKSNREGELENDEIDFHRS